MHTVCLAIACSARTAVSLAGLGVFYTAKGLYNTRRNCADIFHLRTGPDTVQKACRTARQRKPAPLRGPHSSHVPTRQPIVLKLFSRHTLYGTVQCASHTSEHYSSILYSVYRRSYSIRVFCIRHTDRINYRSVFVCAPNGASLGEAVSVNLLIPLCRLLCRRHYRRSSRSSTLKCLHLGGRFLLLCSGRPS